MGSNSPLIGGPIMEENPLKSVRRPNALVRLSRPRMSTRMMEVREM